MTAESIAGALGGRRSGSQWVAPCPAHEDRDPSLVRCYAGCDQRAVIDALKTRGVWDEAGADRRIAAEYNYTDECGRPLYQVVRYEPKRFLQRYPDGAGGWIWKKHPRQVLYHLPEVLEAPILFIVEGCKDVETLREWGFVATTAAGGAKAKWLDSYTAALAGRECVIVPDNDVPGWNRARTIAAALLGAAVRVRILELPTETQDISDWFAAGHSEAELIAALEGAHAV